MIPNGAAYDNFPPFANSGTRSAPAEAKYAQGMVPADTFPAEWANYFFHGATQGITRLNADTGSIKKEINNVLDNFNITPDGTLTNQLMAALDKLKQQAALAAHPVGSLYWTSSSENPAVTFGGGTWVQIKDRFILAAGDTYTTVNAGNDITNGGGGGEATVTLTVNQMPSHNHGGTTGSGGVDHTHTTNVYHRHYSDGGGHEHTYSSGGSGTGSGLPLGTAGVGIWSASTAGGGGHAHWSNTGIYDNSLNYIGGNGTWNVGSGGASAYSHTHGINSDGGGEAHNNMPPYIVKFCWERVS